MFLLTVSGHWEDFLYHLGIVRYGSTVHIANLQEFQCSMEIKPMIMFGFPDSAQLTLGTSCVSWPQI